MNGAQKKVESSLKEINPSLAEFGVHSSHGIIPLLDPFIVHLVHCFLFQDSDPFPLSPVQDCGPNLGQGSGVTDAVARGRLTAPDVDLIEHGDELVGGDFVQT